MEPDPILRMASLSDSAPLVILQGSEASFSTTLSVSNPRMSSEDSSGAMVSDPVLRMASLSDSAHHT